MILRGHFSAEFSSNPKTPKQGLERVPRKLQVGEFEHGLS